MRRRQRSDLTAALFKDRISSDGLKQKAFYGRGREEWGRQCEKWIILNKGGGGAFLLFTKLVNMYSKHYLTPTDYTNTPEKSCQPSIFLVLVSQA